MSTTTPPRGFTTAILHSDRDATIEHGALHKPLHLSVAYGYRDARELAAVFQGRAAGYSYGRQGNPTSTALEAKVNAMEEGVGTITFAIVNQGIYYTNFDRNWSSLIIGVLLLAAVLMNNTFRQLALTYRPKKAKA